MRLLPKRVDQSVERAASGSAVPAGTEPAPERSQAGSRERGKARRRLRQLRRMREALLLELGALVFEMERRGRRDAGMLQVRVDRLRAIEEEASAHSAVLGDDRRMEELVAAGVAGECGNCGTLMSVADNFCPNCATPFSRRARRGAHPAGGDGVAGSATAPETDAAASEGAASQETAKPGTVPTEPVDRAPDPNAAPPPDPDATSDARAPAADSADTTVEGAPPRPTGDEPSVAPASSDAGAVTSPGDERSGEHDEGSSKPADAGGSDGDRAVSPGAPSKN